MKLKLIDGEVKYIKKDGTPSKVNPSTKAVVEFCEFPNPAGGIRKLKNIKILTGDPVEDKIILVEAGGASWFGTYLLSKVTDEYVKIQKEDMDFAQSLVKNPPGKGLSLEKIIDQKIQERRKVVNIEELAKEKGLRVWEAKHFDGYWCPEHGEFNDIPDEWDILPSGDGALTQKVREGPHWILLRKKGAYTKRVGTVAPARHIEKAFEKLGGKKGAAKRKKSKWEGQRKREKAHTEKLREAILRKFPNIPESDLENVLNISRTSGAVGSAPWLYFTSEGQSANYFNQAAYLAVRAHVRHNYTNYDELICDMGKEPARGYVADEIEAVLDKWSNE